MKWLIVTGLLLLLALRLGLGYVVYGLYALLGVLLVSRFMTQHWAAHLTASRHCNRLEVEQHEKVAVVVEVQNQGRLRILWALLEDLLPRQALMFRPPRLEVLGQRIRLCTIRPQDTVRILYQLVAHRRGYYQIGPLVAETGDLFGLHRRYRVLSSPSFLTVYPDVAPLSGYEIASPRPIGEVRLAHRLFEDPTRQAGVRAYQPGDPLRQIHWRATARTAQLQSKIYEPSSVAGATIVLDFHQASYAARDEPLRSELAITATTSLAFALFELGQQVGLITNGRDAADRVRQEGWDYDLRTRQAALAAAAPREDDDRLAPIIVPTARGPQQPLRIREIAARLEKTDGFQLPELLQETANRLPRDATVVILVGQVREADAIAMANLKRQGYSITVIVNTYDPNDFADRAGPLVAQQIAVHQLLDSSSISQLARRVTLR